MVEDEVCLLFLFFVFFFVFFFEPKSIGTFLLEASLSLSGKIGKIFT